ncbi:MAG TPA: chondroitinase-B domain-containing protein [Opitutaceae bacterium]|nr:chondroitinase-B domain-containing protein [Opitutaceae bacterium]
MNRLLVTLLIAGSALLSRAATYNVFNASDFNALPALNSGDIVVLHSGTYGALNKTLVSTIADDATAQSDPVFVIADVNGGVDVTAPSQITLQGRGIVLAGLDFIAGSGMLSNGTSDPAWVIRMAADSRHMAVSNVRFLNAVAGDDYGHWIYAEGFNHTIEYCSFEGKSTRNATVAFKRATSEAGIGTTRDHRLRFCYFGPRECSTSLNGFETIRIGDSSSQAHDMNVTIERNVFYRAIWRNDGQKPNDMEIISNKTKGNRIQYNTFLESYGQVTLRHGDACLVEGNFILGGGHYAGGGIALNAANSHQGGIRVIGRDHVIRNNYLANLIGTNLRAALVVMAGDPSFVDGNGSGGSNGYEIAHNAQVYHNTFLDCREINLGYVDTGSTQPTGVRIYNNAWQGSGTSNGIVRNASFVPGDAGGNYIYHPSGSFGWTGLAASTYTSSVSPLVTEAFDHYRIPSASSPLLNAAHAGLTAGLDVRGVPRPAAGKDIGAFEREVAGSGLRPLLRNEVGPEYDGGPAGTYPDPGAIDTQPNITTTGLPAGTVGAAYSQSLVAAGGELPLTWSLAAGALPAGLALSSSGVISGTPATPGTSSFTAQVADIDSDTDTQPLAIEINSSSGDPEIVPVASPDSTPWDTAGDNGPDNLWDGATTDGTTSSRWASNSSPSTLAGAPRHVVVDLGAAYNVTKLVVWPYQSRAYHYEIYVSDSTTDWGVAVVNVQQSSGAANYTHNVAATGRYVRLVVDGITGSTTTWASINELDIFGTPAGGGTVAAPAFSPGGGSYAAAPSVTIASGTAGASIRYTLDGSMPTASSGTPYSGPVTISATATLKAVAYKAGMSDSPVTSADYTIGSGAGAFIMSGNTVVMEAEHASSRAAGGGKSWTDVTQSDASGAASNNAVQALPNSGTTAGAPGAATCRADYAISVPGGAASTFYVHIRARGPSGSDDSVFLSLNGSTSSYQQFNTTSALGWKTANSTITLPAGATTLSVWMREDGTILDKIVVSSNSTLPTGTGPAESPRN